MSGADDDNEAADDQTEEGVSLPEDPAAISKTCSPLAPFDLFGWRPDPELTDDENYMDVVLLITRHSVCDWQGHMGSIIVDPALGLEEGGAQKQPDQKEEGFQEGIGKEEVRIRRLERRLLSHVISAATNSPLYGKEDSDLHAEIDALGQACRSHRSTEGCSVYITMPPCRRCFAALVAFRVGRIVSRKLPPEKIRAVAAERGIEVVELTAAQKRTQMARINALVNRSRTDEELMQFVANRRKRKEGRRRRGELKR